MVYCVAVHGQCQFYHRWFITHWKFRDCIYAALPLGNSCVHSSFVLFLSYCTTIALQHGSSNISDHHVEIQAIWLSYFLSYFKHHLEKFVFKLVYDLLYYFSLGLIPIQKPKLADTFRGNRNQYPNHIWKREYSYGIHFPLKQWCICQKAERSSVTLLLYIVSLQ